MKYCLINNGVIVQGPCYLPQNTENISNFNALTNEELKLYGWLPYILIDNPQKNQILEGSNIDILENEVIESKIYREMTPNEIEEKNNSILERKWRNVRIKRNNLLLTSDWTQLNDSPVDKILWSNYRNQLRDIPQNFSDPDSIIWPTKPNS